MKKRRLITTIIYIAILALAFSWMLGLFGNQNDNLPYSEVISLIESEQVKSFSGSSSAHPDGFEAGSKLADSFKMQWKTEAYTLAYFDNEKWYKALDHAESYNWKKAIDQWITLLDTNDPLRRSCAEFNIAVACYMMGDYALAEQWLDRSDADNKLPNMSDSFRKRLDSRK